MLCLNRLLGNPVRSAPDGEIELAVLEPEQLRDCCGFCYMGRCERASFFWKSIVCPWLYAVPHEYLFSIEFVFGLFFEKTKIN